MVGIVVDVGEVVDVVDEFASGCTDDGTDSVVVVVLTKGRDVVEVVVEDDGLVVSTGRVVVGNPLVEVGEIDVVVDVVVVDGTIVVVVLLVVVVLVVVVVVVLLDVVVVVATVVGTTVVVVEVVGTAVVVDEVVELEVEVVVVVGGRVVVDEVVVDVVDVVVVDDEVEVGGTVVVDDDVTVVDDVVVWVVVVVAAVTCGHVTSPVPVVFPYDANLTTYVPASSVSYSLAPQQFCSL